jgi:large repetitive protein
MTLIAFDMSLRRLASMIVWAGVAATLIPGPGQVAQAANQIETLATSYVPTVSESIDSSGFKHPGLGFTKEMLENVQTQVRAQQEPWNTYFNEMSTYGSSSKSPTVKNTGNGTTPRFLGLASQANNDTFISDSMVVYGQAVMYLITGDDAYRANAMRVIRIYEQMDPSKYANFTDSHIHTGIPLQRMLAGAEIMRHTSTQTPALEWTDNDTAKLSANLVVPVMQTFNWCNCRFMNQHLYSTIAKMSGAIFMGDRAEYNKAVEWFTVNKDAADQGQNGSIKQLFRLVTRNDFTGEAITPQVQHVEMGRDQAHGAGDITNAEILARLMIAQGTKVDPVTGTASTEPDAVGPYEFLDDRILAAAELWSTFMMGNEIPWVPTASHIDAAGNPTVLYMGLSGGVRGRATAATWELFYYYKYVRGFNMEERAPNFTRFFKARTSFNWSGHDGGGDYWLGIPAQAAQAEGNKYQMLPQVNPYREVETRFTALDDNSVAMEEGGASFVRVTATPQGSKLVVFGYAAGGGSYSLRVRTNGIVNGSLPFRPPFVLPDTQGEWRDVVLPFNSDDYQAYTFTGGGTTVDIDHLNVGVSSTLSPPTFTSGGGDVTMYNYVGTTLATTFDFSAVDAGAGDIITYQGGNLPQGATVDPATGVLSWIPTQAGTYDFLVSASDGTTTSTKRIKVIVDTDRQGAVNTAKARYNPATLYVVSTVPPYTSAYNDIMSVIGSASDTVFVQKLERLRSAAAGLQEMTPLLSDGSMAYAGLLYSSSLGANTNYFTDDIGWTHFGVFNNDPRVINFDFGPNFKVAANRFDLTAVPSFPERGDGIAIFASNDNETWTRLTPGLSVFLDGRQTLPMTDEVLKNTRFRFFQIKMMVLTGAPLQPSEFRIYGTRYETVHKVTTVSMSSPQAFKGRIVEGNTIQLSFVSEEPINNVTATIQGMPATVTTTDNLNWTATAVVNAATPGGAAKFLIKYKTQEGVDAEPVFMTTDKTGVIIQETKNYLGSLPATTTMSNSNNESLSLLMNSWNAVSDRDMWTLSQFRVGSSGAGAWLAFDFRGGGTVKLSRVELLAGQDQYYTRINGTVVQGSNDYATWTTISNSAFSTKEWQTLTVNNATAYRYIRMYNPNAWFGNMSELRMYGVVTSTNKIAAASISSAQALANRVQAGDTVKLNFTAREAISNVTATIAGVAATLSTTDNVNYTATATLPQNVTIGPVTFAINYLTQAGTSGYAVSESTDGTALSVSDNTGYIANLLSITTVTDSGNLSQSAVTTMINKAFDNNVTTISDFRVANGSGTGSWVAFDFRGGGTATLARVDVLGNQASATLIKGTVVQGSNDAANWTTISTAAVATTAWQTLTISDTTPYRYIRMYNAGSWYGNMAELRLYGTTATTNQIASASISSAQALRKRIVPGNTVKLSFTAKEAISNVSATIAGVAATVSTTDNINFTATATLAQGVAAGAVKFAVSYKGQSGQDGYPLSATTDGSSLNLVDETDVIKNFGTLATLIDSTTGRSAASTLSIVNTLVDGNLSTGSDFRNGTSSGSGAYIVFDFRAGNQVNLSSVEVIGSQDGFSSRMAGVVIQGSNDGAAWTTLTPAAVNTQEWQSLKVASLVPYRFIRIYNAAAWFGTMRELRLHGSLHTADTTAPATQANAPGATVGATTTVTLTATDAGSGVQATYYTVDGGAQKTGSSIVIPADGPHTLAYWSVDWSGNVEQKNTLDVTLDKTAPVLAGLYADVTAPTNQNVTVTVYYPLDATVKEVKLGETGTWTAYTAPLVLTDNGTVYARSADAAGNVSAIARLAVTNINKIPPAGAGLAVSNTEPTTGNVTVTIAYPANVAVRQYRIGSGAWTAYTGPLTLTENGIVYAQSIDSVGNVSPVTSYAVTNIDRVAPVDAQFSADFTEPTRNDVTVAVLFPADAAIREYKIGADGEWTAYGAPVLMSANGVVFARSADAAGNQSRVTQYTVGNIDRIAPAGAALALGTTAPTNQAVSVTISWPEDAVFKEVRVGEGEWTPYTTGTVVVAEDSTVYARSSDAVGNRSNETSIVVSNIFKVVPTTNATLNPASPNGKNTWYTSDVSVTLAVNPGSYGGAVTTEYQLNGGAWTSSTGAAIVFGEGVHQLGFRSRDQAGNTEQVKTIVFKVDKTLPTLSVALDKTMIWPPNHQLVTINAALGAADAGSGIDSVILTNITSSKPDSARGGDVEAEFGKPVSSFAVRAEKGSVYTVSYTATDKAGNKTVKTATVTVPNDQSGL